MGEKVVVTVLLTVFFNSCVLLKAQFLLCFSAKHSNCSKKGVCLKNRNLMKNRGLLLNMAKRCSCLGVLLHVWFVVVGCVVFVCFFVFEVLLVLWFVL